MKTHSLVARRLLVACALMGGFGYIISRHRHLFRRKAKFNRS